MFSDSIGIGVFLCLYFATVTETEVNLWKADGDQGSLAIEILVR